MSKKFIYAWHIYNMTAERANQVSSSSNLNTFLVVLAFYAELQNRLDNCNSYISTYIHATVRNKYHWIRQEYTKHFLKYIFPLSYVILGILVFVTFEIIPLNAKFVIRNQPNR